MFCPMTRSIFFWYSAIADYIGGAFQLIFVIFFISQCRNSDYTTPYFFMLTIGYSVAFIYEVSAFCYNFFGCYSPTYLYVLSIVEWYFLCFLGFWNFAVGLYRCTAFAFPFKHDLIWKKIKYFMMALILIFPFIVQGHSFLNFHCKTHIYLKGCESEYYSYMIEVLILNSFLSILTLLFVTFSIFKARALINNLSINAKVERRLILQTIFCSFFQIFYYFFFTFPIYCRGVCELGNSNVDIMIGTSLVFYVFQHYSSMIIMLVVSRKMRNDFFTFFKVGYFFNKTWNSTTSFSGSTVPKILTF